MGLIIHPVFRTPVPDTKPRTSGEFLAAEFGALDAIAADHGLTPISAFSGRREVPADFDGAPWELDDVLGPCEDWFPPLEGRDALLALAQLIRKHPDVARRLESPENVADELEDLARALVRAANAGTEFRLGIS